MAYYVAAHNNAIATREPVDECWRAYGKSEETGDYARMAELLRTIEELEDKQHIANTTAAKAMGSVLKLDDRPGLDPMPVIDCCPQDPTAPQEL